MSSFAQRKDPVKDLYLSYLARETRYLETGKGRPNRFTQKELQRALDSRPFVRTRTTGVVGPELDWSVVYSDVYRGPVLDLIREFRRPADWTEFGPSGSQHPGWLFPHPANFGGATGNVSPPAKHGCFCTSLVTDKLVVIRWTHFANTFGIEFDGKRGYRYPTNLTASGQREIKSGDYFRDLRAEGLLRRHLVGKSTISKLRRLAKRGLARGFIPSLVPKRKFTAAQQRDMWRESPFCSWSFFKSHNSNPYVGRSFLVKGKPSVPKSGPALEALRKLQNIKPVKVYNIKSNLLDWAKPKEFKPLETKPSVPKETERKVKIPRLTGSFLRFGKISNLWKGEPSKGPIPFINDDWMNSDSIFNRAEAANRRLHYGANAENFYSRFEYTLGAVREATK